MDTDNTPVYETPRVTDHGSVVEITAGAGVFEKLDAVHSTNPVLDFFEHESKSFPF